MSNLTLAELTAVLNVIDERICALAAEDDLTDEQDREYRLLADAAIVLRAQPVLDFCG